MPITVSDAAAEESLQAYTNPLSMQAKALDDLSDKVLNGAVVSDGNNPFTFLTEFSSNMTANIVNKACECFNGLYPTNAQTATELYRHLSDFDYIGLYATPATTTVELVFDRNFLIDHALDVSSEEGFNEDPTMASGYYSKIVLPAYSTFTVGDYKFGLMYPIEIKVRKAIKDGQIDYDNSVITVTWDASKKNPLMELTSHILEHRDYLQDGRMLTAIEIPIYQFEVENHLENAIGATGFAKRYTFSKRFYAIRVFHFKNGEWNEMAQTFSDSKYDPEVPTAIVKVLTDLGKVEVVIPHIYFNSTDASVVIGNRIVVKIYTTQGEMNVDLSEYRIEQFQASFLLTDANLVEDDRYSNMLKRIPTIFVIPTVTKISSGTNGLSFAQLRNRVKYNNSFTVKITPTDLQNYFNTSGYKFTKELDNITDRVYCAHKLLKDGTGTPIASGQGYTYLSASALNIQQDTNGKLYVPGYSTLTVKDDNTITILPNSIYRYEESEDLFYLMSDAEVEALNSLPLQDRITNLNDNLHTYSPFHTVLSYSNQSPIAGTYDMFKPVMKDRMFVWENDQTTAEISIYNATIEVNPDGGYILKISIFKTANIADVLARTGDQVYTDNFKLMLSTTGRGSTTLYLMGEYAGAADGRDTYVFYLNTDFKINSDSELFLTNFKNGMEYTDQPNGGYVTMDFHDYTVSLCMLTDTLNNYNDPGFNNSNTVIFNLPPELNDYTMLCRQSFKLKLGEALPLLRNNVTISTTDETYATYSTTQFATYQAQIYDRWTIQDAVDGLCTTEDVGKLKLDENNHLIVKHDTGDVILSSQYDVCYGPTLTLTVGGDEDKEIDTLELVYDNENNKITATSSVSNVFGSINGDIFVQSKQYPELSGVYKVVDRTASTTTRVWKHQFNKFTEIFDTSVFALSMIPKDSTEETPRRMLRGARAVHEIPLDRTGLPGDLNDYTYQDVDALIDDYFEKVPLLAQSVMNGTITLYQFEMCIEYTFKDLYVAVANHFSRLSVRYLFGDENDDPSQYYVVTDWRKLTKFFHYAYDLVPAELDKLNAAGYYTPSRYSMVRSFYFSSAMYSFPSSDTDKINPTKMELCVMARHLWENGNTPPEQDFSMYQLDPTWKNYQDTITAINELKALCIERRQKYVDRECSLSDITDLIDRFVALAPSIARHEYNWTTYDEFDPIVRDFFLVYRSLYLAVSFRSLKYGDLTNAQVKTFWEDMYRRSYDALIPADEIDTVYSYRIKDRGWDGEKYTEYSYSSSIAMRYQLIQHLSAFDHRDYVPAYGMTEDTAIFYNDQIYQRPDYHQVRFMHLLLQQTSKMSEELEYETIDTWSNDLCSDLDGWRVKRDSWPGACVFAWSYDTTYGVITRAACDVVYDATAGVIPTPDDYYYGLKMYYKPAEEDDPEPVPEPIDPEPEPDVPEPEEDPEGSLFYSSNNKKVKDAIAGVDLLREINTSARGYDRKWFLLSDNSEATFDFEHYTGFVIEYECSGISLAGTTKCWVLNYYYLETDEEGDQVLQCETMAENLDVPGTEENPNPLPEEYWETLKKDPYIKGYISTFHEIDYVTKGGKPYLVLREVEQDPLYEARCIFGSGSYNVIPKYEPWDVVWTATNKEVIDTPIVDCIVSTSTKHRISTVDALAFINAHLDTGSYKDLYRDRETLVDPKPDSMFISVSKCKDSQTPSELNYIGYRSLDVDDTSGEDVYTELGTYTALGAIYYRDIEMTNYNYEDDELKEEDVRKIINAWYTQHENGYPDNLIYDNIIKTYSSGPDKISLPLNPILLSKIVSSSAPCYFCPWRKLITSSSASALGEYLSTREYGSTACGFISIVEDTETGGVLYINLLSKFTRTIGEGDEKRSETEFYVNPNNLTWNEIDKWPWEYTTPWIDFVNLKQRDDISIEYNSAMSSTQVLYGPDTVKIDEDGNPIVDAPRALTYGVEMIHCDYKLSLSEDAEYSNYMEDVRELLRAYFAELKSITPSLLARTKLYFSPIRTFGHAEFKGSNGSVQMLPVQFTAELGLHIEAYVKSSTLSKNTIREAILSLIDKDMKDGTINLALLAKEISDELSDNVLYVDVLGLNGVKTQQTMIPVSEDTYPQLKQILVMYEDRTVHVDRALELDWYVIT